MESVRKLLDTPSYEEISVVFIGYSLHPKIFRIQVTDRNEIYKGKDKGENIPVLFSELSTTP
jgi:hypothetical protein